MKKAKSTDELVQELFDKVQTKRAALAQAAKPCWTTGGLFGYNPNSAHDKIDIKSVPDTRKLVEIYAFLSDRKNSYETAASELGVDKAKFSWLGFTAEEWKSDLQIRVTQLQLQHETKELNTLEARLNNLVSPELRAQMELNEISKLLA